MTATADLVAERGRHYGHPKVNFTRVARLWEVVLGLDPGTISAPQVGLMMLQVKVSREINAHHQDNLDDIKGYAETIGMCHEDSP